MELNKEVFEILKEFKIDKSEGILCLLGIYYELDVEKVCSEETIKAINLTKIVDKDYNNKGAIVWNMPLFAGTEHEFSWVKEWIEEFGKKNPERKGSWRDATTRMKVFFAKYPQYRKEDIYRARDAYFATVRDPQYLISSHKFIFDGIGGMKKSTLLAWCEKGEAASNTLNNVKGKIMR